MNTIVKFYLVGLGTVAAPLWFDTQTITEPGEGEAPVDPGQLDFSKTETSGHLVTIGVL